MKHRMNMKIIQLVQKEKQNETYNAAPIFIITTIKKLYIVRNKYKL